MCILPGKRVTFNSFAIENNQIANSENSKIFKIVAIIEEYKKTAKTSRDWTKCNQLIQEIEEKIAEPE